MALPVWLEVLDVGVDWLLEVLDCAGSLGEVEPVELVLPVVPVELIELVVPDVPVAPVVSADVVSPAG